MASDIDGLKANMAKMQTQIDALTSLVAAFMAQKADLEQVAEINTSAANLVATMQKILDAAGPVNPAP